MPTVANDSGGADGLKGVGANDGVVVEAFRPTWPSGRVLWRPLAAPPSKKKEAESVVEDHQHPTPHRRKTLRIKSPSHRALYLPPLYDAPYTVPLHMLSVVLFFFVPPCI